MRLSLNALVVFFVSVLLLPIASAVYCGSPYHDPVHIMAQNRAITILDDEVVPVEVKWYRYRDSRVIGPLTMYCRVVKVRITSNAGDLSSYVQGLAGKEAYMVPYCVRLSSDYRDSGYPQPVEGQSYKYWNALYVIFPGAHHCYRTGYTKTLTGEDFACFDTGIPFLPISQHAYGCKTFLNANAQNACMCAGSFLAEASIQPVTSASIFGVPLGIIYVTRTLSAACCPNNKNFADYWFKPFDYSICYTHYTSLSSKAVGYVYDFTDISEVPTDAHLFFDWSAKQAGSERAMHMFEIHIIWGYNPDYPPIIPDDSGEFYDHCASGTPKNYYSSSHRYTTSTFIYTGCGKFGYSKCIQKATPSLVFTADHVSSKPICGNGQIEDEEYNKDSPYVCCVDAIEDKQYQEMCLPYCCITDSGSPYYGKCAACYYSSQRYCPPGYHVSGAKCVPDQSPGECTSSTDCANRYGGSANDWICNSGECICKYVGSGGCCLDKHCSGKKDTFGNALTNGKCVNHHCVYDCPFECCPEDARIGQFYYRSKPCSRGTCSLTNNGYECITSGDGDGGDGGLPDCPFECCPPGSGYKQKDCPADQYCSYVYGAYQCIGSPPPPAECTTNADCGEHEQCVNGECKCEPCYTWSSSKGKCVPVDCGPGKKCDPSTGQCVVVGSECNDPFGYCIAVGDQQVPLTYAGIGVLLLALLLKRPRKPKMPYYKMPPMMRYYG